MFPNFLIAPHPDYVMVHTLWPDVTGPDADRLRMAGAPEEPRQPTSTSPTRRNFWDMTNRQDWHVCELAQAGICSRGYRPGPYSNREDLLHAFDRFIVETLEAE